MMAKEKAEQLVREYYKFGMNKEGQSLSWYECKQCALIAVKIVLESNPTLITCDTSELNYAYWIEVKKEIEKL